MSIRLLLLSSLFLWTACSDPNRLGTRKNPIKITFTPSNNATVVVGSSQQFLDFLTEETGYQFEAGIPTSYVSVIEAFGQDRADVAIMNSLGYIIAHERYGVEAKLTAVRFGSNYYRGMIVARADSGIESLEDLAGKSFAFTDSSSASGYLFPLKILQEKGVELNNQVFAMTHDAVLTMVYQGQVDAGAAYYSPPSSEGSIRDARERIQEAYPDVGERIEILALTDNILNDPIVFRQDMPEKMTREIIRAMLKFLESEEGREAFAKTYSYESAVPATDADYDGLRKMIETAQIDPETLIRQ